MFLVRQNYYFQSFDLLFYFEVQDLATNGCCHPSPGPPQGLELTDLGGKPIKLQLKFKNNRIIPSLVCYLDFWRWGCGELEDVETKEMAKTRSYCEYCQ